MAVPLLIAVALLSGGAVAEEEHRATAVDAQEALQRVSKEVENVVSHSADGTVQSQGP